MTAQAQIPSIVEVQNFDTSDFTGFINGAGISIG
jgi:hypothetical protein